MSLAWGQRVAIVGDRAELTAPDEPRAVDFVVEMRRYDDRQTLAARLDSGELSRDVVVDVRSSHTRCAYNARFLLSGIGGTLPVMSNPVLHLDLVSGAVADLSHRAGYVHWHFFQMSWPNIIVILAMIGVFWLAIALPFPAHRRRSPAGAGGTGPAGAGGTGPAGAGGTGPAGAGGTGPADAGGTGPAGAGTPGPAGPEVAR